MVNALKNKNNPIKFKVERENKELEITTNLVPNDEGVVKTGLYVKDQINGIGTLTYIDPNTKRFGALGHEIIETTTAKKFEIKDGKIFNANVSKIEKSRDGTAGEKNATYNKETVEGEIDTNEIAGIFGDYKEETNNMEEIEVGKEEEIKKGRAYIRTNIEKDVVKDYEINILNIDYDSKSKNILFEITDKTLLEASGGVIQGMSGSPIIQNNKLIGAVNYVILNDTKKGYGIFITTMLEQGES